MIQNEQLYLLFAFDKHKRMSELVTFVGVPFDRTDALWMMSLEDNYPRDCFRFLSISISTRISKAATLRLLLLFSYYFLNGFHALMMITTYRTTALAGAHRRFPPTARRGPHPPRVPCTRGQTPSRPR